MESKTPRTDAESRTVKHTSCFFDAVLEAEVEVVDAKFARQLETELAEARAEIAVLKAALWYFGNSLGPDVAEELENALPERLSRKINLTEIANTNGEAALEAAERGE